MEWANFAVSLVGVAATALTGWIAWLVLKRQREADLPLITAEIGDWVEHRRDRRLLHLTMRNRADFNWLAERIEIHAPGDATIMCGRDMPNVLENRVEVPQHLAADASSATRTARLQMEIAPVGTRSGNLVRGSDEWDHETLLLFVSPSSRERTLSMRLTLASKEAVQRRIVIPIKRTLPADPTTTTH